MMRRFESIVSRHRNGIRTGDRLVQTVNRFWVIAAMVVACACAAAVLAEAQQPAPPAARPSDMPMVLQRGLPGPGQALLKPLEGTFRVEMSAYMGPGTPEKPAVSTDITCRRTWIAGGRFLHDLTEGSFAGSHYYREGLLGFSNVDQRFEWVTVDAANANMMIYRGANGSGPHPPIEMSGVFTDQGWLGENAAGKSIRMRTVITIENNDRHVLELFFTAPGGPERLVDRKVYTRIKD
jgi:hypothetical protein